MRARVAIALLLAALPAAASAATMASIAGTARAELLVGTDGSDRVVARAGNDRIAVEYDGGVDSVSCGPGLDVVAADARDRVGADCELVARRIHRDRLGNPDSQHESEVEPDVASFGSTTVSVFQVGRFRSGGAAAIGFATSKDGGITWREGLLPALTQATSPPGGASRASDPVVAYDAVHETWIANALALEPGATRLTVQRSRDGVSWSAPAFAAESEQEGLAFDKNWLACDGMATSPFRGRCYLVYTLVGGRQDALAVQSSDDGGRTWSEPATRTMSVTGAIPVVQRDGTLHVVFWSGGDVVDVVSADGGVTLDDPVKVADLRARDARPFRAPPLAAADLDSAGRVVVVWQDCRFSPACAQNDVVLSRSSDGRSWSAPLRVTNGRSAVIPTLAVDPLSGRIAIAYYASRAAGVDAELVTSADGVRWSAPRRISPRTMPLTWLPETALGRMLADYIGVTWTRGRPVVVYALASPPRNGKLRQAIYAARG